MCMYVMHYENLKENPWKWSDYSDTSGLPNMKCCDYYEALWPQYCYGKFSNVSTLSSSGLWTAVVHDPSVRHMVVDQLPQLTWKANYQNVVVGESDKSYGERRGSKAAYTACNTHSCVKSTNPTQLIVPTMPIDSVLGLWLTWEVLINRNKIKRRWQSWIGSH